MTINVVFKVSTRISDLIFIFTETNYSRINQGGFLEDCHYEI